MNTHTPTKTTMAAFVFPFSRRNTHTNTNTTTTLRFAAAAARFFNSSCCLLLLLHIYFTSQTTTYKQQHIKNIHTHLFLLLFDAVHVQQHIYTRTLKQAAASSSCLHPNPFLFVCFKWMLKVKRCGVMLRDMVTVDR